MDKRQEANDRAAFARIWAIVGCFGSSHSAQQPTLNIQPSSQPSAVKGPEKYPPGLLHAYARRASSSAFPFIGCPSHTDFNINHYGAIQKRERIHIPDWRAENGDSVVHPPSRFYPFGTSQPSHASGRTRVKRSQSVAFLSSSVKTYARTSVKPVSPIKCPYTACPSRIAAKETPYCPYERPALGQGRIYFLGWSLWQLEGGPYLA